MLFKPVTMSLLVFKPNHVFFMPQANQLQLRAQNNLKSRLMMQGVKQGPLSDRLQCNITLHPLILLSQSAKENRALRNVVI